MFEKNAKSITIFFIANLASFALYAEPQIPQTNLEENFDLEPHEDELLTLDRMISLTEKQQIAQKKLKILINEIRRNKEIFMKGDQSKLHAFYMIRDARESLQLIRQHHLEHLFSSDFMDELALLAQIGSKASPGI